MSTNTQRLAGHKLNYSNPAPAFFDIIKNVIPAATQNDFSATVPERMGMGCDAGSDQTMLSGLCVAICNTGTRCEDRSVATRS